MLVGIICFGVGVGAMRRALFSPWRFPPGCASAERFPADVPTACLPCGRAGPSDRPTGASFAALRNRLLVVKASSVAVVVVVGGAASSASSGSSESSSDPASPSEAFWSSSKAGGFAPSCVIWRENLCAHIRAWRQGNTKKDKENDNAGRAHTWGARSTRLYGSFPKPHAPGLSLADVMRFTRLATWVSVSSVVISGHGSN